LTQLELANRLGLKYYAFVSQVETGFSRLPTEKMEAWARSLRVDPQKFARHLLSFYEPELHRVLYQMSSCEPASADAIGRE
jgi:transcriptional regulator with XRE-family HTH domain